MLKAPTRAPNRFAPTHTHTHTFTTAQLQHQPAVQGTRTIFGTPVSMDLYVHMYIYAAVAVAWQHHVQHLGLRNMYALACPLCTTKALVAGGAGEWFYLEVNIFVQIDICYVYVRRHKCSGNVANKPTTTTTPSSYSYSSYTTTFGCPMCCIMSERANDRPSGDQTAI